MHYSMMATGRSAANGAHHCGNVSVGDRTIGQIVGQSSMRLTHAGIAMSLEVRRNSAGITRRVRRHLNVLSVEPNHAGDELDGQEVPRGLLVALPEFRLKPLNGRIAPTVAAQAKRLISRRQT